MKARVDSGELSKAVRIAQKYTRESSTPETSCAMISVRDGALWIRTTTWTENCLVRINAFDCENGICVVLIKHLSALAFDTGGMIDLRTTKTQLIVDTSITMRIRQFSESVTFPEWPITDNELRVPSSVLAIAMDATIPAEKSGRGPGPACVHIVPHDETSFFVFGVDTIVGARAVVEGKVERMISIDARLLKDALSIVGENAVVYTGENTVEIRDETDPGAIAFSLSDVTQGFGNLAVDLFEEESTGDEMVVTREALLEIIQNCRAASQIDEAAEISLECKDGLLWMNIAGNDVEGEGSVDVDGNLPQSVLLCKTLAKVLASVRNAEQYTVSAIPVEKGGKDIKRVHVDGVDKHVIGASIRGRLGRPKPNLETGV